MSRVEPDPYGHGQVRATYDTVAADYAAHFPGTGPEAPVDLAMVEHFVALLADTCGTTPPRVLDAGCGTGRMGRFLADRGCQVAGVDLSPGMLAMARRDHPDLAVQVGSLTDLPAATDSFDGALYWYSVIHSPPPALPVVLAEAARVVKSSGLVLLAFQAGTGSRDVAQGMRDLGHDVHLTRHHRTADQLGELLSGAGITEVARLVRAPRGGERDPQAFVLGAVA